MLFMKRIFFLALMVISLIAAYSQKASSVVVVLKNGTEITGKVKEFYPTTKIVLSVGGFDTTINMSEVNSVTDVTQTQTPANLDSTKSEIYETAINLPRDTIVNICGVDVNFILMSGGKFKYGFDGRGSMSMESEPVHDVVLSPYYVSEEFVSRDLYEAVMKTAYTSKFSIKYADKEIDDESLQRCAFFMSETLAKNNKMPSVEEFIETLQNSCGDTFDLPTEVQWFFYESRKSRETTKLKTPALYILSVRIESFYGRRA